MFDKKTFLQHVRTNSNNTKITKAGVSAPFSLNEQMGGVQSNVGMSTATAPRPDGRPTVGPGGGHGGGTQLNWSEMLGQFMNAYGTSNPQFDFNGDGVVDNADLGIFLSMWGNQVIPSGGYNGPYPGGGAVGGSPMGRRQLGEQLSGGVQSGSGLNTAIGGLSTATPVRDTAGPGRIHTGPTSNGNGPVSPIDWQQVLGSFLNAYGTSNPEFDFNGDGIVNAWDLGILLGMWGGPVVPAGGTPSPYSATSNYPSNIGGGGALG